MSSSTTTLPSWPYIFATVLPTWLIGVFLVAQTPYAHTMCDSVGFPQPRNTPFNSFFYLFVAKELIYGFILFALESQGEWKAVGIVLVCMCVGGLVDMYLSMNRAVGGTLGWWGGLQKHGCVSAIGFWAAVRILGEN